MTPGSVHVHGAGKVGTALARSLRKSGWSVELTSHRRVPVPLIAERLIVIAVRDPELGPLAARWASAANVPPGAVVLHTAGAMTHEVLDALRASCRGVAQMHPLLSFSDGEPPWSGATMLVDGDRAAVAAGRRIARALGMRAVSFPALDRAAYHAAAGLVAGGAAALMQAAVELLEGAGVERAQASSMLVPLLGSVVLSLRRQGLPHALSGAVRRGDATTVGVHVGAASRYAPRHEGLIRALGVIQIEMARELGEASEEALAQVQRVLTSPTKAVRGAKREGLQGKRAWKSVRKVDRRRLGR